MKSDNESRDASQTGTIVSSSPVKGEISSGAIEGLNNKIRVVTRRSYGFRI